MAGQVTVPDTSVRVRLEGLRGEERRNALATMSIAVTASERSVTEARVRRLHARAPDEIALALQPFGYHRPEIHSDLRIEGTTWLAHYVVDPGPRVVVQSVAIDVTGDGAGEPRFRQAVDAFPLRQGAALSHAAYELGKTRLFDAASELGYLDARFVVHELRIDLTSYTAAVVLVYETGPRFRFGAVSFDQDVLDPDLLRSFVQFERGEPFNVNQLVALQSALGDSPYFSRVEVVPRRELAQDREVPVEVLLVPRQTQRYEAGVGYGTDTGPRASFQVELRRLNRVGHRALGEVAASPIERRISTQYVIPQGLGRGNVLALAAGFARLTPSTSVSDAVIVSATLGRPRGRWQETFALTFQLEDFQVGSDTGTANLLMPGASWSRTVADDRLFPSHGSRVRFELSGAIRGVGSNASFGRARASGKLIRTLLPHTRLLARLDLGGTATNQLRDLPPSIRFFTGGDQSVRGYEFRSLGPVDEQGNVVGGRVLLVGSVELDREIIKRFGIAGFWDAGNALDRLNWSLEQGVGGGVRWLSPVGLVRLDLAVAISRAGKPLRLHITVGPDL
ncbi:MAG: hypothetical protein AMS18_11350 [Gemmatimonas sp. SG8_17]|nr:MAG: hypothetical protein AMS18_11350 [Gemmatimonas sp. SG8_17]